jgi:outer membrane immunogenic protein
MRSIALACVLLFGGAAAVMAQATPTASYRGDAALTYHWIRTNDPPGGGCGCFDLNGGGLSGSWMLLPRLSVVGEVSVEHAGNVLSTGKSLTLTSYLAGARYRLPQPWLHGPHAPQPFAQALVGGGHAGGGIAGIGDGSSTFVTRIGGGIDLPMRSGISIRLIQADYYLTDFANSANDHQNNLLLSAGVVLHWTRLD